MILVKFTPSGGSLCRIAMDDLALEYQWYGYITAFDSLRISMPTRHGGFVKPEFSQMTLSPDLMTEIGSYPRTAAVQIIETETDETAGTIIFDGSARLDTFNRNGFTYTLKRPEIATTIAESTAYNNTLVNVATTIATGMGLTIDTTYARASSPSVLHTTSSEQLAIDLLSDMCAFFSHAFTIVDGVLYLYDMLGTRSATTLTEFDTQPCEYRYDSAYSLFRASDTETLAGSDDNGDEYSVTPYHTTSGNIQAALADIKTIVEQPIPVLRWKTDKDRPSILDQISYADESLVLPVTVAGTVTSIIYSFGDLSVEAELTASVTT